VGSYPPGHGGFVTFPSAVFVGDPRSNVSYRSQGDAWDGEGVFASPSHEALATARNPISSSRSEIHIVDAATGADRAQWNEDASILLLGWRQAGIYYLRTPGGTRPAGSSQLRVLDPATGVSHEVTIRPLPNPSHPLFSEWTGLGGDAVWATVPVGSGEPHFLLARIDPINGVADTWLDTGRNTSLRVIAWDLAGHPLVALTSGSSIRVVSLPEKGHAITIDAPGYIPASNVSAFGSADSHGTWATASDGAVWRLRSGPTLERVSAPLLPPAPSPSATVALDYVGPGPIGLVIGGPCA